ncbi:MAG: Flp family type IVb pilin [Micrococcales bacterium]
MIKYIGKLRDVFAGDRGASAVEYALLVGLIAIAIIVAVSLLGGSIAANFNNVATQLPTP